VARAASQAIPARRRGSSLARQEAFWGYVFLVPWLIGLSVFVVIPLAGAILLSFTPYSLGRPLTFNGVANYARAFTDDPQFYNSIQRTFTWALSYIPLAVGGALGTAMLLNQGLKGTNVFRTIFFLPHLVPIVASIYIWSYLLNPKYGLINEALFRVFRLDPGPGWFASKDWALPSLVLLALWAQIGGNMMLIFLAGLQGVPKDLYEVADLDGANGWQRFRNITLPMISPTIFFNLVLGIIGALSSFSNAFVATNGGPAYATYLFALHIYKTAFDFSELGYASTLAVIFFILLSVLTYGQFWLQRRWVYYAGEVK
jgi:multiple sugar transport system permease protein